MAERRSFSSAEIKLLDALNAGRIADFRSPVTTSDKPAEGKNWGDERTISAATIRAIINDAIPGCSPTAAGVHIAGVRIAGEL